MSRREHTFASRRHSGLAFVFAWCGDVLLIALPWLPFLSAAAPFRYLGLAALAAAGISLAVLCSGARTSDMRPAAGVLGLLVVANIAVNGLQTHQSLSQLAQFALICATLYAAPLALASRTSAAIAIGTGVGLTLVLTSDYLTESMSIFQNRNMIGSAAAGWTAVTLKLVVGHRLPLPRGLAAAALSMPLALVLLSQSRASLLLLLMAAVWVVPPFGRAPVAVRTLATLAVLTFALGFALVVYDPSLAHTNTEPLPTAVDSQLHRICGSCVKPQPHTRSAIGLSSRDIIWSTVIYETLQRPLTGFGLGRLPHEVLSGRFRGLSAHNGYVQLFYQTGFAGVFLFAVACTLVAYAAARRPSNDIGLALFAGTLVHEIFEVSLTQNNFGLGVLLWLVIAMPTVATSHDTSAGPN